MSSPNTRTVTKGYSPKPDDPNVKNLTRLKARKILFRDRPADAASLVEAGDVEFKYGCVVYTIHAKREVVPAAV
jgi:hypothetical protein